MPILPFFAEKLTKRSYDCLIIDGSARISEGTFNIAKVANLIIQPVEASLDDLNPAIREFNGLVKSRVNKNKLVFVINRISSPVEEKAGYYIFPLSLSEKISYREAQNQGLSISEVKYPRLSKQAQELVKSIIKKIGTI